MDTDRFDRLETQIAQLQGLMEKQAIALHEALEQQSARISHLEATTAASHGDSSDSTPLPNSNLLFPSEPAHSTQRDAGMPDPRAGTRFQGTINLPPVIILPEDSPPGAATPVDSDTAARKPAAPAPSRATRRAGSDFESLVGGRLFVRIAAVALILGLAFGLKAAADEGWLTEWPRIAIGIILAGGLLAAAELTRRRGLTQYSYGLSGAGFAVLDLSLYAAFNFYHLIGFTVAFAALSAANACAVGYAVFVNAEPIAALGAVGGFLTPMALASGTSTDGIAFAGRLFLYIWLIDAGVLACALHKDWRALKAASLLFTQIFLVVWITQNYRPELFQTLLIAGTLLFLLFIAVAAAYGVVFRKPLDAEDLFLILENPAVYAGFLTWAWSTYPDGGSARTLGVVFLILAALYAILGLGALRHLSWDAALPISLVAVASAFTTAAIPMLVHGRLLLIGWAVEALVLLWGGCAAPSRTLRAAGFVVYCLSAVDLFYHMTNSSLSGTAGIAIPFAVTAGALLAGERLLRACRAVLTPDEVLLETVLADSAYLIGWWWISLEVSQISGGGASASVWMSGAWSLYSAGLLAFGVFIRRRAPRQCGLALLAAAIAKVFLYDIWQFDSIYRVLSLLTLSAALWGASYLYNRCRDRILDLVLKQD